MKGMQRKRRYFCAKCLTEIYEYPALVMDSSALWCDGCKGEDVNITYTVKRICSGVYQYTFNNGLVFNVVKIDEVSSVNGMWYFVNATNSNEGGNDYYNSKRDALDALIDYINHRDYDPTYGWVYNPEKGK